jgi:hypothetical protein
LSIRVPVEIKATLHALSRVQGRPQWRLVTDAVSCYLQSRPESERRLVSEIVGKRASKNALRGGRVRGLR